MTHPGTCSTFVFSSVTHTPPLSQIRRPRVFPHVAFASSSYPGSSLFLPPEETTPGTRLRSLSHGWKHFFYILRLFCRYSFDPRDLLVKILTVLVRMANASEDREFVKCLAANPDYSRLSIEKALCVVQRENLAADHVVQDLRKVMQEVFYSFNPYVTYCLQ